MSDPRVGVFMVDGYTFLSKEEVDAYYEQQAALEWAARGEE